MWKKNIEEKNTMRPLERAAGDDIKAEIAIRRLADLALADEGGVHALSLIALSSDFNKSVVRDALNNDGPAFDNNANKFVRQIVEHTLATYGAEAIPKVSTAIMQSFMHAMNEDLKKRLSLPTLDDPAEAMAKDLATPPNLNGADKPRGSVRRRGFRNDRSTGK